MPWCWQVLHSSRNSHTCSIEQQQCSQGRVSTSEKLPPIPYGPKGLLVQHTATMSVAEPCHERWQQTYNMDRLLHRCLLSQQSPDDMWLVSMHLNLSNTI